MSENEYICHHCSKKLACKRNLVQHIQVCKVGKNSQQRQIELEIERKFENQYQSHQDTLRRQLEIQQEALRQELELKAQLLKERSQLKESQQETLLQKQQLELQEQHLKAQLETQQLRYERELQEKKELIDKLQEQLFELAKLPKNTTHNNKTTTNNNNQRTMNIISQLAPYDLTEEFVREVVEKHYDEKTLLRGPEGLVKFVVEHLLTQKETGKKKMLCSDMARKCGKYLAPDGKSLIKDAHMHHTLDLISPPLCRANLTIINAVEDDPKVTPLDKSYCHERGMNNMIFINSRGRFSTQLAGQLVYNDPSTEHLEHLEHLEEKDVDSESER